MIKKKHIEIVMLAIATMVAVKFAAKSNIPVVSNIAKLAA